MKIEIFKRLNYTLSLLGILFLSLLITNNLWAEEVIEKVTEAVPAYASEKSMAVGLGLGLWQAPEDADFNSEGMPMDLFFDWNIDDEFLKIRAGYNSGQGKMKFDKYGKTITSKLSTTNIYVAYRYTMEIMSKLKGFGIGGLGMMSSKLEAEMAGSSASASASGIGYIIGIGAIYDISDFGVGGQFIIASGSGDFGGASVSTGYNQLQVIGTYAF